MNIKLLDNLEEALAIQLPDLLKNFSAPTQNFLSPSINPFTGHKMVLPGTALANITVEEHLRFKKIFHNQKLEDGKICGFRASEIFRASGLPENRMAEIWDEADQDKDGNLTETEFINAMCSIQNEMRQQYH
jgi:hypothetical protein